jgi:uncharacterized membrane protein
MKNKQIERANLEVESALGVFVKAQKKVKSAISKLEGIVTKSEVNIAELNEQIREEEEIKDVATSHIEEHKATLEKFSKFLP